MQEHLGEIHPLTDAEVRRLFPDADSCMLNALVIKCVQAVISADGPADEVTDASIAEAVRTCSKPGQTTPMLYLRTVPSYLCNVSGAKNDSSPKVSTTWDHKTGSWVPLAVPNGTGEWPAHNPEHVTEVRVRTAHGIPVHYKACACGWKGCPYHQRVPAGD